MVPVVVAHDLTPVFRSPGTTTGRGRATAT